jgi:glycosyltransferase involved in cell wall biosynthesis
MNHRDTMNCYPSISVIVPVYNEIELVDASVRAIDQFLAGQKLVYEIIIIESGSTDSSDIVCDRLAEKLPAVNVIHETQRNGLGSALRLGYAAATKELVWLVTVDIPFPLETLCEALPLMSECDFVLSYRSEDNRGLFRRIQSWGYNTLVKTVLLLPMRTVNSAFKLYRRTVLSSIPLNSNGWFLDAEVLYWVARRGYRFHEIAVPLLEREAGTSKIGAYDIVWILRELIKFRWSLMRNAPGREGVEA